MKILCLQLARFGDVYQTWPVLNGLRRENPGAEIHFLVRERFREATVGLLSVDKVISLPSREIFTAILCEQPQVNNSLKVLEYFIEGLTGEKYDRIINLSFSPASSYLVDAIAGENALITGYTRQSDGFLKIPDDASRYFYAQVGTGK